MWSLYPLDTHSPFPITSFHHHKYLQLPPYVLKRQHFLIGKHWSVIRILFTKHGDGHAILILDTFEELSQDYTVN